MRDILEVGSIGNSFIQLNAPWKLLKENPDRAKEVLATGVNIAKILSVLLKPILPSYADALEKQLGLNDLSLADVNFSYENRSIVGASIVLKNVEPFTVSTSDPFADVDLRVGRIVHVEDHSKADKLYVMRVSIGGSERQLVAGVRHAYAKEELLDRLVVVVANLKPAVLRGVKSDGMLLAAVKNDGTPVLLHPSKSSSGDAVFVDGVKGAPKKEVDITVFSSLGLVVHKGSPSYKTQPLKTKNEVLIVDVVDGSVVG